MAKSGWFKESHRHSLASHGIKTATPASLKGVEYHRASSTPHTTPNLVDPYEYQDTHQERIIHTPEWAGLNFRFVLEGSGDVFRELTNPIPHYSYIGEKFRRIEEHIVDEQSFRIHPDDGIAIANSKHKELLMRLESEWDKQPTNRPIQEVAVRLNKNLINGRWDSARADMSLIRDYMQQQRRE